MPPPASVGHLLVDQLPELGIQPQDKQQQLHEQRPLLQLVPCPSLQLLQPTAPAYPAADAHRPAIARRLVAQIVVVVVVVVVVIVLHLYRHKI